MRLTELEPRWINPNLLAFRCPCCKQFWLTCKNIPMRAGEQFDLFEKEFGADWNRLVIPCDEAYSWTFSGTDFETLTVVPSIDASNARHAHISISNGEII